MTQDCSEECSIVENESTIGWYVLPIKGLYDNKVNGRENDHMRGNNIDSKNGNKKESVEKTKNQNNDKDKINQEKKNEEFSYGIQITNSSICMIYLNNMIRESTDISKEKRNSSQSIKTKIGTLCEEYFQLFPSIKLNLKIPSELPGECSWVIEHSSICDNYVILSLSTHGMHFIGIVEIILIDQENANKNEKENNLNLVPLPGVKSKSK